MDPTILQFMTSQGINLPQMGTFQEQPGVPSQLSPHRPVTTAGNVNSVIKKRKLSNKVATVEEYDMDDNGAKNNSKLSLEAKRSQHCEVEKKRRERMNRCMTELAQMIPACNAVPRKLDKLSVLKMAVDHMKSLQGSTDTSQDYKPGFLTDDELKKLIVEAANGFMMIVGCSQAKILYVSDTISDVLQEKPEQWIGSCLYDLLHQMDIAKVRDQLSYFDANVVARDSSLSGAASTPLVMHGQTINGLRRSFLCRVKKTLSQDEDKTMPSDRSRNENYSQSENFIKLLHPHENYQYAVLHCTGFIRDLTLTECQSLKVEDSSAGSCLVAVARLQHFGDDAPKAPLDSAENEFVTRVAVDGRFSYVDPRVASVLGYLPQELIGQVSYEYYHPDDIQKMVHLHHDAMKRRIPMPTVRYRFLCKDHKWLSLAMKAFAFVNPFSQQVEYVVCTNVVLRDDDKTLTDCGSIVNSAVCSLNAPAEQQAKEQQEGFQQGSVNDPLSSLLFQPPGSQSAASSQVSMSQATPTSSDMVPTPYLTTEASRTVISSPAAITMEENAATAQHILDEYNRVHTVPPVRKDLNYSFPEGLFTNEVNLVGSEYPYRHILQEFHNPAEFTDLFKQVPANPFNLPSAFEDLDLIV